ncbi:alcohol dehydrogenase catalytic domain-containing protein [Micromonospora sp. STR1_7]|uniref:Alcohol dehydrogenase catalytic domain-containing protein n=1 Tax=Micromonospora parastrephiae TaxID=2806101 RepID=A0ABS1XQJ9_9ACTN|nr:alcohol dehydrogenase catalytic domain-containing protein [Micromonospora parastrephiae]MBM0231540.1 alcohol dehydrogenase catalytic domain-containing protein [Micromonospora parastrephiae]
MSGTERAALPVTVRALVARASGAGLAGRAGTPAAPGPGEVRVTIRAAGVCHSDLSMVNGTLAPKYPLVLGHEATGVVAETGPGVRLAVGTPVVLNWAPACRACWWCRRGEPWLCADTTSPTVPRGETEDGVPLHLTLGLGALAEAVVVPEKAVIPVPAGLPPERAALLGCAVLTGVGAVHNTAGVAAGESVAVIGLGGVGLAVLTAARRAGATTILAVDVAEAKRDLALAAGATDFLLSDDRLSKEVRARTEGRGVDHAFECVGRAATIRAAWRLTRRGGAVTVVGMGAKDDMVSLGALDIFHSARTLRSSVYGSSDPDREVPALAAELADGALDLRVLVSGTIPLDEAPTAFDRLARGEGARWVVTLN